MVKSGKAQYSEQEAAQELGISIEHLRSLIRRHVVHGDDELPDGGIALLQPSDLLLLRILSRQTPIHE